MAVHHWPLGLAPTSPSSCCHIHRGMGGWGGGAVVVPIHTRCPPGGPPPMHPCSPPPPTRNAHASPAPSTTPPPLTFVTTGGRGTGMGGMTSWPSYDTSWPSLPRAPVTPNNTPRQPSKQGSTATRIHKISRGCVLSLSNRPSLPPPTSRSPLLCLFACVCLQWQCTTGPLA